MSTPAPVLAGRFALIIDGLCRVIAARGAKSQVAGPLIIMLLWNRLRRTAARFAALAARVQAGTLPSTAHRRRRTRSRSPHPGPRLPTSFGWLLRLAPGFETACYRSQLHHFLSDSEVTALLAASPQFGRMLRPLCHMLRIELPESLAPPPPAAAPDASLHPPGHPPGPQSARELATGERQPPVLIRGEGLRPPAALDQPAFTRPALA